MSETPVPVFLEALRTCLEEGTFVKLTLSKAVPKTAELRNVYGRLILLGGQPHLSFTYRYATRDETHNFTLTEGLVQVATWLGQSFLIATLRSTVQDLVLQYNKKRRPRLQRQKPSIRQTPNWTHNQAKQYPIEEAAPFLERLGIAKSGRVLKAHQDKFRQINKSG